MPVLAYSYGADRYGTGRYGGDHPLVVIASVDQRGIPFIVGNDRYQIVCCDDPGTTASAPSFRYWYAGPPLWDETLSGDSALPPYFALDEHSSPPLGSLSTPYAAVHLYRSTLIHDAVIAGLLVDIIPMPASVENITATVGFTAQVEGFGLADYDRADGSYTVGTAVSESFTFSESQALQGNSVWPNMRSIWCPLRLNIRQGEIRALLTDISLCEIASIRLVGTVEESRTI